MDMSGALILIAAFRCTFNNNNSDSSPSGKAKNSEGHLEPHPLDILVQRT